MLTARRNTQAAHRVLRKALKLMNEHPPSSITTDKLTSYPKAISAPRAKGYCRKMSKIGARNILIESSGPIVVFSSA
jgi:transposase-like protein